MSSSDNEPIETTDAILQNAGKSDELKDESIASSSGQQIPRMPDGRSLRATGRTHQFSTRIKLETHDKMKWFAFHQKITLGELLERMLDAYERENQSITEKSHQI